jgi:hypothetical protein
MAAQRGNPSNVPAYLLLRMRLLPCVLLRVLR